MEVVSIPGVSIISTGLWNGRTYSGADLDNLVAAFHALRGIYSVPGKLGHNDEQQILASDGLPAAGWVTSLYRKGNRLLADFADVPRKVADLIKANAYRTRSCEIWFNTAFEGVTYPAVLKAVSWLGEDAPAVSSLDDIIALYTDAENRQVTVVMLAASDESFDRVRAAVFEELGEIYPYLWDDEHDCYPMGAVLDGPSPSIRDCYVDHVIVTDQDGDTLFSIPFTMDEAGTVMLGEPTPVRISYQPLPAPIAADQLTATPSAATPVAQVETPTAKPAALPVPKADASDPRLAQPRLAQPPTSPRKVETMEDTKLRTLLGLAEDADLEAELIKLKATHVELSDHESVKSEVAQLRGEVVSLRAEKSAESAKAQVVTAIRDGKLAPKQREWAEQLALTSPESFTAYLASAPKIVEFGERGSASDASDSQVLTEAARVVAAKLGISEERLADPRPLAVRLAEQQQARELATTK